MLMVGVGYEGYLVWVVVVVMCVLLILFRFLNVLLIDKIVWWVVF